MTALNDILLGYLASQKRVLKTHKAISRCKSVCDDGRLEHLHYWAALKRSVESFEKEIVPYVKKSNSAESST